LPTRLGTALILAAWALAAASLLRRDIWPEIATAPPPDFRAVAAELPPGTARWRILAADPRNPDALEPVGRLRTETLKQPDGSTVLASEANIRVGDLLADSPAAVDDRSVLVIRGRSVVDASGGLSGFRVEVDEQAGGPLLAIDGRRAGDAIALSATSPLPLWKWRMRLPYRPGAFVQSSMSPFDAMPGLQVGQRWEAHVVHPLTGQAQTCTVAVVARKHITWDQNPTPAFVVETRMAPITARTWVRPDGLVLRQEVPLPLRRIVLEREP
jgi:hypothetical protein